MSPAPQGGRRAAQAFMGWAPPRRLFGLLGSIQAYMNGLLYGDPALGLKGSVQQARGQWAGGPGPRKLAVLHDGK